MIKHEKINDEIKVGGHIYGGAYIREEKTFNLQSVELITFLSFFQYKARILAYFTSCKM